MDPDSLTKFWPLIYDVIRQLWSITGPHIEDAAVREDIPVELYYYSELGLDTFSIENFQKRDQFSNPEQFERLFARLNMKGWIEPMPDKSFKVTERARQAARLIIQAGDMQLLSFEWTAGIDLERLAALLERLAAENHAAPEPPKKWAIRNRFRVADEISSPMIQVREYLMDLFAYRDDSHLSAAGPHFNQAGIVWSVLGALWTGEAVTPRQMAQSMAFRGYTVEDYEVAIKAAVVVGWAEEAAVTGSFCPTAMGKELRERVEQLTNEYFFYPWSVFTGAELEELHDLLTRLNDRLKAYRKAQK